jgi:rare lipoprotein A
VVLTVNDRGPFVGNREIDLSYGAAKALGVAEKGLALVHVELLPPSTSLAQDASGFYLQTGSFKDAANARSMTQHLSGFGFKNAKVISGASHYRVVVGPYDNPEDAHAAQSQLKQDLGINAVFSAGE